MLRLRECREKCKLSQKYVALTVGVAPPTVSQWESGLKSPSRENLQKLADLYGVSMDYLSGRSANQGSPDEIPIRPAAVPIVGEIACGTPITAEQNVEGYAALPDGVAADFALRCRGDSMAPTFENGDLVLIRSQPEVEPGQIAAVLTETDAGSEATLKRVYPQPGGLLLVADNPAFPPLFVSADNAVAARIQGLAVGYVRMLR